MPPNLKLDTESASKHSIPDQATINCGPNNDIDYVYRARHGGRDPPTDSVSANTVRPKDIMRPQTSISPTETVSDGQSDSGTSLELKIPRIRRTWSNTLSDQSKPSPAALGISKTLSHCEDIDVTPKTRSSFRRSHAFIDHANRESELALKPILEDDVDLPRT